LIKPIQFNEKLSAKEDWLFWIEITTENIIAKYLNEELAFYRTYPTSMSKDKQLMAKNSIMVNFLIVGTLKGKEKEDFIQTFSNEISNHILKIDDLYNEIIDIRHSHAYRLGKFILKPFSFIRHRIL
jgi:hypothetical protein